jgi:hypothetical protein
MSADVVTMMRPDPDAMMQHLDHMFGGYLDGYQDGLIELAWTNPVADETERYRLRHAQLFTVDQFDEIIAKAVEVNSRPRTNVYIGASLKLPDTAPFGRTVDADFYVATCAWADLDDADANALAKHRITDAKPTLVVRTGSVPHKRHQLWWRLAEPVADPGRLSAICKGMSVALSGDGSVYNPGRVMRLAGTIAWDQKPGRVPEVTGVVPIKEPGPASYYVEHLEHIYPPLYDFASAKERREKNERGPDNGIVRSKSALGLDTNTVVDGREKWMRNLICARMIDYIGRFGAAPTAEELFDDAWPKYEETVDLSRPGRGKHEFMDKCRYTVSRFLNGQIRGAETLDKAVKVYREKKDARQNSLRHQTITEQRTDTPEGIFEFLDIAGIKALPDPVWIVDKMIPEDALGFIYGPPGHGKSFIALDLALSVAYAKGTWWADRAIKRPGLVVYIAREGQAGLKNRIEAWQRTHGVTDDAAPFALIRAGINFMSADDVTTLIRTVEHVAQALGADPSLVFVDTVSRVLPGADENGQKEMTLFVAACDAVRDRFRATVVGVHHSGKSGDMRGSTVLKGAGDFVYRVERADEDDPESHVEFTCEKLKDDEDGWVKAVDLEPVDWVLDGVIDGERRSLVPRVREAVAPKKESIWPDKGTCENILAAIRGAWGAGDPWSNAPQAKRTGRYAPERISRTYGVRQDHAERMIHEWLSNDILRVEKADKRSGRTGLNVVGRLS